MRRGRTLLDPSPLARRTRDGEPPSEQTLPDVALEGPLPAALVQVERLVLHDAAALGQVEDDGAHVLLPAAELPAGQLLVVGRADERREGVDVAEGDPVAA